MRANSFASLRHPLPPNRPSAIPSTSASSPSPSGTSVGGRGVGGGESLFERGGGFAESVNVSVGSAGRQNRRRSVVMMMMVMLLLLLLETVAARERRHGDGVVDGAAEMQRRGGGASAVHDQMLVHDISPEPKPRLVVGRSACRPSERSAFFVARHSGVCHTARSCLSYSSRETSLVCVAPSSIKEKRGVTWRGVA